MSRLEDQLWFSHYIAEFADPISLTSERTLSAVLQQGVMQGWNTQEMSNAIDLTFQQWMHGNVSKEDYAFVQERLPPHRRELIARTETTRAVSAGATAVYEFAGCEKKEWSAANDIRTRDSHRAADGQVVPIRKPFLINGYPMMFPGDMEGGAPLSEAANCRCTVLPVVPEEGIRQPALDTPEQAPEFTAPENWRNLNDAKAYFKQVAPDMAIEFSSGVPWEVQQECLRQLAKHGNDYPDALRTMRFFVDSSAPSITTFRPNIAQTMQDPHWGAFAIMTGPSRGIVLREQYFRSLLGETPSFGAYNVTDTTWQRSATTHEFGHIVHGWLNNPDLSPLKLGTVQQGFRTGRGWTEYATRDGFGFVPDTVSLFLHGHVAQGGAKTVSGYAMTNDLEKFAESFTIREHVPRDRWRPYHHDFDTMLSVVGDSSRWRDDTIVSTAIADIDERDEVHERLYDFRLRMGMR